jgi:hypothetical protein
MRRRRVRLLAVVLALVPALLVLGAEAAGAAVITSLTTLANAALGRGWAPHPDQTTGGSEQFVTGPLTPPAGIGSLQMAVAATTDRALIFIVPKPGAPADPTPPGEPGPIVASPWNTLSGSFSTFTANTTSPASSIPVLKFVGYQVYPGPLGATGFTTLNFEGSNQGTVSANQWQTWTLGPTSRVWQSNTSDGFCQQAAPCTLSAFAAQYSGGAWGMVQVGLGAGVPAGSTGNVDDVHVSDGTTTFVYDFDVTPPPTTTTTIPTTTTTGPPVAASGGTPTPAASTTSGSGELPRTGTHSDRILAVALAGIGLGAVLSVVTKRRRITD